MAYTINRAGDLTGTSFHDGYIKATYNQLVSAFGEPVYEDINGYKVTCEWELKIVVDGYAIPVEFTVYDWKEDVSPLEDRDSYYEFHIGTQTPAGTKLVIKFLGDKFLEDNVEVYCEDPYNRLQRILRK